MKELIDQATSTPGMEILLMGSIGILVITILLVIAIRTPNLGREAEEWVEKEVKKL